jgi:chromate reductase
MKAVALCGSLRKASTNKGLLRYARDNAPDGIEIEIADLSEIPFYNQDITEPPVAVENFFQQLLSADALVIACNEYNYSLAPVLKNALDWASREPNNIYLNEKPVAIMGSAGGMGSSRAQYHLRQVLVFMNMFPLNKPEVFVNAFSGVFDEHGNLIDPKIQGYVVNQLKALQQHHARLQAYKEA